MPSHSHHANTSSIATTTTPLSSRSQRQASFRRGDPESSIASPNRFDSVHEDNGVAEDNVTVQIDSVAAKGSYNNRITTESSDQT